MNLPQHTLPIMKATHALSHLSHAPKVNVLLIALLSLSAVAISGCDHSKRQPAEPQVEVAKTPPLQAGTSISNRNPQYAATTTDRNTNKPRAATIRQSGEQVKLSPTDKSVSQKNSKKVATAKAVSIVTNKVTPGTPEATLKQAIDALYSGSAKEAAKYYQVNIPNFAAELEKNQAAFQDTVEAVTITNTNYSKDKSQVILDCEIKLKGEFVPKKSGFKLKKIKGQWKILG